MAPAPAGPATPGQGCDSSLQIDKAGPKLGLHLIKPQICFLCLGFHEVVQVVEVGTRCLEKRVRMSTLLVEALVDFTEALVDFVEALVDFAEALVDFAEALVDFAETRIDGGKTRLNLRIELVQSIVDRLQVIGCSHSARHPVLPVHDRCLP